METSTILIIIAALVVAGIFWIVIHSRNSGQKHVMQTSIKAQDPKRTDSAA